MAVGSAADIVRGEPRAERRDMPKRLHVDDRDVCCRAAERDPEPLAEGIDRKVPCPAGQAHAAELGAPQHVDGNDTAAARVGDECVPAVGMRGRVARFDQAAEHVSHPEPIDERDCSQRGVAHDGAVADELDRPRIGQRRDRTHDAIRAQVDDRKPLLGVAGDERRGRGVERRPQAKRAERRCGGEEGELAAVHGLPTTRKDGEVPRGSLVS